MNGSRSFLNADVLRPETVRAIEDMGEVASQIADRWAGGWPKQTRKLEREGKLLPALEQQVKDELEVDKYLRENSHVGRLEALRVFELADKGPPA